MKRTLLLMLASLSGCATVASRPWVDDALLKYDASKYPDDAAVVLSRSEKTQLDVTNGERITRLERHEVTAVLGEAGFWLAEVAVPFRAKDKLTGFRARLVQPDGTRREFDAKDFLSDVSAKGDRGVNVHFFRFPDVRVGSVLEYWWVVEKQGLFGGDEQETLGEYPVKHYEFELTAAKPLVVETIEWNDAAPIQVRSLNNGDHQLRFELNDLPPRDKADFMPHYTFTEPRWAWRVVSWRAGSVSYDWFRDWKDVVGDVGEKLYVDRDFSRDFDLHLDTKGCNDVHCLVARATALVHARVKGTGRWGRTEPLKTVLASGKASVLEEAAMVRLLLREAGVDAQLAFGTDALSTQLSPSFPRFEQFNHAFVWLPAQKGLTQPMTIDADCSFCKPGELTARHRDQRIFVFTTTMEVSKAVTEGRWVQATAQPSTPSEYRYTHAARWTEDGVVHDRVTTHRTGLSAVSLREDFTLRRDKLEQRERDWWNQVSGLRTVSDVKYAACAPDEGQCEWSAAVDWPTQAWKSGAGWAVQLGFLSPHHQDLFDAEERTVDVHFSWDDTRVVDVVELTAPPGHSLALAPSPVRVNAGSLRASVVVERTPTGARVTRTLERTLGFERRANYADLRAAADAFKRARHLVLQFNP